MYTAKYVKFYTTLLLLLLQLNLVLAVEITNSYPSDQTFNISSTIEINATITDADGISSAYVNITYPNSTIQKITLNNQSNDKYNTSFIVPSLPGDYSFLIWANDTLDNKETSIGNFTAVFISPTNIPGIRLWLDASDNSTLYTDSACSTQVSNDNDEVLCWQSKSQEVTNATVLSGKNGALYRSNSSEKVNGLTTLRFNKSNETVYETGLDIRANTTEDLTIFTVYRPRTSDTSDQGQAIWGNDDGSWDRFYYSLFAYSAGLGTDGIDDGLISLGGASNGLSIDKAGLIDTNFLLTAIYNGNVSSGTNSGPTDGSGIYFDGELQTTFTDESHATAAQTQMFIGRDGDNGYYDGDLVEMIIYDTVLNACELEIVNKHLSSKYGKDFFGVSDNYGYGSPHDNDINGISEINGNCTTTVEITSATSSIATISSPTNLDLNDSLTFAHDNGGFSTILESPAGYESRINQSWKIDEDNEVGNITISFDMSTTTISTLNSDFALIIDTNTNFTDANIHTTGFSVSGSTVTFTGINFSNADYFTLAVTENFNDPKDLTNLRAWYDATDNETLYTNEDCTTKVTSQNQEILCWQDKSDYAHNATNVTGKGTPQYITNEFNGLSVLSFNKTQQDTLRHTLSSQYTSNFTIFTVIQSKGDASTYDSFFSNGEPASSDHFQIDYTNDSGVNSFRYGASAKFNFGTYSNEIKLYSVTHNGTFITLYNEGTQVNNGSTTEGQIFEHYRINQNRNGNQHHDSKIAEIILYGRVLSKCELEKVDIYLGEKYGRDFFGVSDNYDYTEPHDNDINGIGEFTSSCTTTKEFITAKSSIATIFNPSSLDLNDALTFAHDNSGYALSTNSPESYESRIKQSWRTDKDNNPGNVSISFDLSSTNIAITSSTDFALLIDNDTNFSDATIHTTGLSISESTINFTTINFTSGGYFTLAINQKAPNVEFTTPTLPNGTIHGENSFTINMTSNAFGDDHYAFVNFDNSLLMWLRMDDTNTSGHPTDASGNTNNGTLAGDTTINTTGRFGSAAHFDGNGDYINLPSSNALVENTQAWAISLWFNTKSISANPLGNRMLTLRNTSSLSATAFTLGSNNKLEFFYRNQQGTGITTNITTISTNTWYHYAVTYNGTASKIYVNGALNSTISDTITSTSTHTARIGANPSGSSQFFNGSIDEVLIFNHQLPDHEIQSLYNASENQFFGNTTTLNEGGHTFTGYAVGINGQKNQTQTRTVTLDFTPPNVTGIVISPLTTFNITSVINISTNATDNAGVQTVLANITLPNGTINQIALTHSSGNNYNGTYNSPGLIGNYTITIIANDTIGNLNGTENTTFEILNDIPTPSSVQINDGINITLNSGNNSTIIGSATITDLNGYQDISSVTGYFFLTTLGVGADDNRTNHYTSTCISNSDGSVNTESYNCTFNISHYATPTDPGSNQSLTNWTFLIAPLDSQSIGTTGTDVININTLLSFAINPSIIDFGNLNLGTNTTTANEIVNVTNLGNVGIDLLLSGTNLSCSPGIVQVDFLEYKDSTFSYGSGIDLLESSMELDFDARQGDESDETPLKQTYYGLGIPDSSVGGNCSGSITITGQSDPHND